MGCGGGPVIFKGDSIPMKKKVYIFDFDGTIVDSMNEFADIASKVINKYYGTPIDVARRQYFETSGLPFFEQLELLHPKDKRNAKAADEYETTKKGNYLNHKPFDDVREAIKSLANKEIKTVVSSNNFQNLVDDLVKKIGVKFDMVLGWRENFAKGRDHFEHVRKKFGCEPDEMVFVGDSLKDADRANDYGINFVGKTGTFTDNDFEKYCGSVQTIASLNDLLNENK